MTTLELQRKSGLTTGQWIGLGAMAAVAAVIAVLIAQAVAIAIWPEVALFKPLDSYARSALFTIVPAFAATALFAWLARRRAEPEGAFVGIAAVVLLFSFLPDYLLPVPDKTFLASTIAAVLHVIAAAVIVLILIGGRRRLVRAA